MKCNDVEKFIYVYLDEEFDRQDSLELEAHMRECKACRDLCAFEERFRVRLRNQLSVQRAPSSLRDRVMTCISAPATTTEVSGLHAREPSYRWIPMALAASVAAVVFWPFALDMDSSAIRTAGILGIGAPKAEPAQTSPLTDQMSSEPDDLSRGIERNVVEEAVETHEDDLPMDMVGDATTVGRYLTARTLLPMTPPLPETRETRLIGVRVLRTGLRPTAMYTYDHMGRRMTVVQRLTQRQSLPFERQQHPSLVGLRHAGKLNVAVLRSEATVSAVVSDMSEQDLAKIIPSNYTAAWAVGH